MSAVSVPTGTRRCRRRSRACATVIDMGEFEGVRQVEGNLWERLGTQVSSRGVGIPRRGWIDAVETSYIDAEALRYSIRGEGASTEFASFSSTCRIIQCSI